MTIGALLQDLPRRLGASLGLRPNVRADGDLGRHASPFPYDVLQLLMDHMDTEDLLRVKRVNRTFYSAAQSRHRHALRLAHVPTIRGGGIPARCMTIDDITRVLKREVALANRLSYGRCQTQLFTSTIGAHQAWSVGNNRFVITRTKASDARRIVREKLTAVPFYTKALELAHSGTARPLAFKQAGMKNADVVRVNKLLTYQRDIEALRSGSAACAHALWDMRGWPPRSLKLTREHWLFSHVAVSHNGERALMADADGLVSSVSFEKPVRRHAAVTAPLPVLELLVVGNERGYAFALLDGIYGGDLREHHGLRRIDDSPVMNAVRISGDRALMTTRENLQMRYSLWSFRHGAKVLTSFTLDDASLRLHCFTSGTAGSFALFHDHRTLFSVDLDKLAGEVEKVRPRALHKIFSRKELVVSGNGVTVAQGRETGVMVTDLRRNDLVIRRHELEQRHERRSALSPNGAMLATANGGWLELVSVRGPAARDLLERQRHPADVVAFSHDGAFLATAAAGQVHVWCFARGAIEGRRQAVKTDARASAIDVSDDSQVVTATFEDGCVARYDFTPLPQPAARPQT